MNFALINDVLSLVFVAITLAALIGPMLFALYEVPVGRWISAQKKRYLSNSPVVNETESSEDASPELLNGFKRLID